MTNITQTGLLGLSWLKHAKSFYRVRHDQWRLSQFDDHMLKDIGLHRSDIYRAVRRGRPQRDMS
jgi:uncharacterized protein YjiS (DUF1127 family)